MAKAFAAEGAFVAAVDKNSAGLERLTAELNEQKHCADGFALDVSDRAAVEWTVEQLDRELGPIGTLVNVAGLLRLGRVEELSDEDWGALWRNHNYKNYKRSKAANLQLLAALLHLQHGAVVGHAGDDRVAVVDRRGICAVFGVVLAVGGMGKNVPAPSVPADLTCTTRSKSPCIRSPNNSPRSQN